MPPWVIVAGGFHAHGGMDTANLALARYLAGTGRTVHLVGHDFDAALHSEAGVAIHPVRRPRGLPGIAEALLDRAGRRVAARVVAATPDARILVNGGNCGWPDVNWVHAVHAAWPVHDVGAPAWSRLRNRFLKARARRRERRALSNARLVIANSRATQRALVEHLAVPADRVQTVYLGCDPAWAPAAPPERAAARLELGLRPDVPVVAFVGALGTDTNKGFDLLRDAWTRLQARGDWNATLLVAGGGWRLAGLQRLAARQPGGGSVHFLGFTPRVRELLAAADLLVSPVRYEAYGLNVHEALCRGLAVMVTRTAGVAERFDAGMADALLPDGMTAAVLAERLRAWRADPARWRLRAAPTAARLRAWSWNDMAAELVALAEGVPRRRSA